MFVICVFSASFLGSFFAYLFIQLLLELQRSAKEFNANLVDLKNNIESIDKKTRTLRVNLEKLIERGIK